MQQRIDLILETRKKRLFRQPVTLFNERVLCENYIPIIATNDGYNLITEHLPIILNNGDRIYTPNFQVTVCIRQLQTINNSDQLFFLNENSARRTVL